MVGWGYPPNIEGGLDVHVANLVDFLRKDDSVDVSLALPSFNIDLEKDFRISLGVEEGNVLSVSREISKQVASIAEDFDIIHTHDWFGAEAGFKAQKYSDCKWVSTMHSLSSDRFSGSAEEVEKLEKLACSKPDKVLAVSKSLKRDINRDYNSSDVDVVYNGFSKPNSTGLDVREKLGLREDNDIVFFVGRHAEQKGVEHLIYGFSKYLESGNEAFLVLGGDGYLREEFEDFVELLGIEENVLFEGFIPEKVLGDYYRCADVFVSPSISEPFGLTITEALAVNTPVLATESGVGELLPQRLIEDIEPDSESIKDGLENVLSKSYAGDLDYDSRSWEEMSKDVLKVYDSL